MKKLTISVPLSIKGIEQLIDSIESYRKWLQERSEVLLDRLAAEGYEIASYKFNTATYDGTNDVNVSVENRENNVRAVVAFGTATLFIEFGTGVRYPDNHPEMSEHGMKRGSYGKGMGKRPAWGYYGEPGSHGKKQESGVVITHGNPANMSMYRTIRILEERLPVLAKEVFQ